MAIWPTIDMPIIESAIWHLNKTHTPFTRPNGSRPLSPTFFAVRGISSNSRRKFIAQMLCIPPPPPPPSQCSWRLLIYGQRLSVPYGQSLNNEHRKIALLVANSLISSLLAWEDNPPITGWRYWIDLDSYDKSLKTRMSSRWFNMQLFALISPFDSLLSQTNERLWIYFEHIQ